MAAASKAKVATSHQPLKRREASAPALTVDKIREQAAVLDAQFKALEPKQIRSGVKYATEAQSEQMKRLEAIDYEIEVKTLALSVEREAIIKDLKRDITAANVAEIQSISIGLRFCAEPADGGVSVRAPTVKHQLRNL